MMKIKEVLSRTMCEVKEKQLIKSLIINPDSQSPYPAPDFSWSAAAPPFIKEKLNFEISFRK